MEILFIIVGIVIGLALGYFVSKTKSVKEISALKERNRNSENTNQELIAIRKEKEELTILITEKSSEASHLQEKLKENKQEVEKLQEKFTKEFENLANKILESNSKQQLEELNKNNIKISQEAINLTKALKGDNKTQGNWGELVLETVLEKSGLEKGREYEIQQSFLNEEGKRLLPDVVINLPGNKKMVIDSKVSLIAYEQYINTENKEEKKRFLSGHIASIKRHINDLNSKKYEDIYKIESPDFILMFIPIESALYLAQNEDKNFFYTAFHKNILLVSPTTLLSTLRTIDTLWSNEKQQQNAFEIAKHATSLYEKFKNLLDDLETVGNRIKSTSSAYEGAMKKLTGNQNLIKDITKLKELGIAPKKDINQKWIDKTTEE